MQNNSWCAFCRMQRSIDLNMCINLEEMPLSCNFCGSYYGCFLTMHIAFSLCLRENKCFYRDSKKLLGKGQGDPGFLLNFLSKTADR